MNESPNELGVETLRTRVGYGGLACRHIRVAAQLGYIGTTIRSRLVIVSLLFSPIHRGPTAFVRVYIDPYNTTACASVHFSVLHGPGLGPRAGPARSPWAGPGRA